MKATKEVFVSSPLLKENISNTKYIVVNTLGDISLIDTNDATSYVQDLAGDDVNLIFSMRYKEELEDEMMVVCIAVQDK